MRKTLICLTAFAAAVSVSAQDVIVRKDGTNVVSKVEVITTEAVTYKLWDDLNGPSLTIPVTDIYTINYPNGESDAFATATGTELSLLSPAQAQTNDIQKRQSSTSLEYDAIEDGGKIGLDFVVNGLLAGFSIGWGDKTDYVKSVMYYDAHIGANYRYFVGGDVFYIEGRALVGYAENSFSYLEGTKTVNYQHIGQQTYETWKEKTNKAFYVGFTPRVGLCFDNFAIYVGYRWDFEKFKFKKEAQSDYFTIGISTIL